ncbi:MAG: 2-oxoacid:acceptor oxidoreductase family protein, partial [Candidatus Latescibacterota bacterium]
MRIGRSKSKDKEETFPGYPHALDGHAAAYAVETTVSDAVVVQSAPEMAEITGPLRNLAPAGYDPVSGKPPAVRHVDEIRPLLAQMAGYSASGLRSGALVNGLASVRDALYSAAGKRLTYVLNITCRAIRRQTGSLHGGHEDYYAAAGSGVFQMFAKNPQEAADFTLIAHRTAELSLTPGVCAQDYYQTSQSVQGLNLPEHDLVNRFLGRPGEMIESPTPAQAVLFGPKRRRVPALVDADRPAGVGGVQDGDAYYKAVVAQYPFFSAHLGRFLNESLELWGDLTGRRYRPVSGYRTDDADYVVIAQGAVVEALEAIVDELRETSRVKVGVVNLSVYRPFPGAELTRLLKGKKAVTVLERTDHSLAEDLPMARDVRSAVDKALENGAADGSSPHSGYDAWQRASDRPRVIVGVYGVGGAFPSSSELKAVYRNMTGGKNGTGTKSRFYLGAHFDRPTRRFPHLQSLQQRLRRDYPNLDDITLTTVVESGDSPGVEGNGKSRSLTVYSLSLQGGVFAGNLFAQVISDALETSVRTFPLGGLDPGLQPSRFTLSHSDSGDPARVLPEREDIVLVNGEKLLEMVASRPSIRGGGTVVVGTNRSPEQLWDGISRRTKRWIREMEVHLYLVDAAHIASEAASKPQFTDQLTVWALLGAGLKLGPGLDPDAEQVESFSETLRSRLQQLFGANNHLVEDISSAVKMGYEEPSELQWRSMPAEEEPEVEEPEAPWTVRKEEPGDDSLYDPARFWRSVGFLYDVGEPQEELIDPYVALGVVPGGSSAYHDMAPYRMGVPGWLAENCTGCGLCWTQCPDSALPATIQSCEGVIKHAMGMCERDGVTMIQMQRVTDHLAKQAYRVAAKDDLCQHRTMGDLLRESFTELVVKMKLDDEKLQPLQSEFDKVVAKVEGWPIARTERFFDAPHVREKGSG